MYMLNTQKENKAFTLIELLVVIAIIGLLATVVMVSLNSARKKARDARRLQDMKEITTALELYYDDHGRYPNPDGDGVGGWDLGNQDYQLLSNGALDDYLKVVPNDLIKTGNSHGYRYYRYPAGSYGCDPAKGAFYVLEITDMETSSGPHPQSHGWSCPNRDWHSEAEWVTGRFENG